MDENEAILMGLTSFYEIRAGNRTRMHLGVVLHLSGKLGRNFGPTIDRQPMPGELRNQT